MIGAQSFCGQYVHGSSPFHRLDPRAKVMGMVVLGLGAAIVNDWRGWIWLVLVLLSVYRVAQLRVRDIAVYLRPFWLFSILAVLLGQGAGGRRLVVLGGWEYTTADVVAGAWAAGRLLLLLLTAGWLTLTTSPTELVVSLRWLLSPLRRLGVNVDRFSVAVLVAVRFLPILAIEGEKLRRAQTARGVDLARGIRGFQHRAASLVIPLFAAVLRRADALADALVVRGYGTGGPSQPQGSALGVRELAFVFGACMAAVAAVTM